MKTALACLFILIAALAIGKWQGSDIDELQHRLERERVVKKSRTAHRDRRDEPVGYRSKYERKGAGLTAAQALAALLAIPKREGGVSLGGDSLVKYRSEIQVLAQLDLSGLVELVELVRASKDPALFDVYGEHNAMLCIIAMADLDPHAAIDYVAKNEKRLFRTLGGRSESLTLPYLLSRMADRNPQGALDRMLAIRDGSAALRLSDRDTNQLLGLIARWEPLRVLETVGKLPEEKRNEAVQTLFYQLQSDDEWTAIFQALRSKFGSQPEKMAVGMKQISQRFMLTAESPDEARRWVECLGMTDSEKRLLSRGWEHMFIAPEQGEAYARWFADFLPPSEEKTELVLEAAERWGQTHPGVVPAILAFLREQGIEVPRRGEE